MTSPIIKSNSSIPNIRFPGYTSNWGKQRFVDSFTKIIDFRGRTPLKLGMAWGGTIPSLSALNVKMGYIDLTIDPHFGSTELYKKWMTKGDLLKNDIIFTMEAPLGNVALVPDNNKYILSQRVLALKTKEQIDNLFLYQLMSAPCFQDQINKLATGSTAKGINQKSLQKIAISVPSLEEQKKISQFLSMVDSLLNNLRSQKTSLESYKKSIMQKIFSQEIRFKDDNRKIYPDWEVKRLEDIGTVVGGGTPDTTKQEYWNGEINWFTPSEIKEKYSIKSIRKISESGLKHSSARVLPIGTLLFTSRATIGEISISREVSTTNQGFQSIIVNDQNSNEFLYYWMKFNQPRFLRLANGSTFLEISSKEMKSLKDLFPSISEQLKIANFLSAIDTNIESKQNQIAGLELWKKGLMQRMFI